MNNEELISELLTQMQSDMTLMNRADTPMKSDMAPEVIRSDRGQTPHHHPGADAGKQDHALPENAGGGHETLL